MTSYATPPFAYDPSCKPAKSILKQVRLGNQGSSWFQSMNSKLAIASSPTTDGQIPESEPTSPQKSSGLMRFRRLLPAQPVAPPPETSVDNTQEELLPKELKRVRFSVRNLTTEYYPYQTFPSGDTKETMSANEDPISEQFEKTKMSVEPATRQRTTPQALHALYDMACKSKEEPLFPGFLTQLLANQHRTCLTRLDFSNQPITRRTAEPLADVLCLDFGLKELILNNCDLEDDTIKVLLHSLLLTDTLCELSLMDNKKIKTTGFKYVAVYIKGASKLQILNLTSTIPDKKAIGYLAQALIGTPTSASPSLSSLILDNCGLKLPLLETLAAGIRQSTCLRHLSLRYNRINYQGAMWVGVMLRDYDDNRLYQRGLESLAIDTNELRQGVQYIAQALRRNKSLLSLSMNDCKIDTKGCMFIGEALKYNQSLKTLSLSYNSLGQPTTDGVVAIRQALYVNQSLKELSLAATELGSEAAIALAECLPENSALNRLDVSKNPSIDIAGLLSLSTAIKINYTLTFLDVNIPPNDRDLAKIQSDIAAYCTRNAQSTTSPNTQHQQRSAIRRTPSQNALSITTTQATARLSLQERLAAVTQNASPRSSSPSKSSIRTAEPVESPKRSPDQDLLDNATGQITVFEEMLSAESHNREVTKENNPANNTIIQLYRQCQASQDAVSLKIPRIADPAVVGIYLGLNDRLLAAIGNYNQLYPVIPAPRPRVVISGGSGSGSNSPRTPSSPRLNSPTGSTGSRSPINCGSFASGNPEMPLSPFEIGDDDDDEEESFISARQSSPVNEKHKNLEELRHAKEIEEGSAFKQASKAEEEEEP
ncbi:hypothetical protein F4703DRAFT_1918157 [Phycomyces blakesleeanus]